MNGVIGIWMGALGGGLGLLTSVSHAREFTGVEGQKMVAEPASVADGKVIFFCGAGVSAPAGLPMFRGLVDQVWDEGVIPC